MSQETHVDLAAWWDAQNFDGKELFRLDESGSLILSENNNIREREIAKLSADNCDLVLKTLQDKFGDVDARIREMELEWLSSEDKLKLSDKVHQLKEFLHSANAVGNFSKPAQLVHDWEHTLYQLTEEHYQAKLKLAELAESLSGSDQWKDTTQAYKDLADKWKQTGAIDKSRSDKLWGRIEAAKKVFHDRKRQHHEEEEKDMLTNLDLKIELVEKAEALAASEEWKNTTDAFMRLTEEWKSIGPTMHKKNEELWQRFIAAKGAFFDKKREHSGKIHLEQEHNYTLKLALVERAEALRDSKEWNATAQAYAALMEEWKKTGRVPQQRSEELWKRFTEAQEEFFEAKRRHSDEIKGMLENNYQQKKVLLERAEQIKNSNHWGETTGEMNDLMDQWKKIGPIPRAYGDKMWEDFNAARRQFFARKDANREQRKQYAEAQKIARTEAARNAIFRLLRDIKDEEEKLEDFRHAIENITPGKKAGELRTHLETLIADSTAKLSRLQEKYAAVQQEQKAAEPDSVDEVSSDHSE